VLARTTVTYRQSGYNERRILRLQHSYARYSMQHSLASDAADSHFLRSPSLYGVVPISLLLRVYRSAVPVGNIGNRHGYGLHRLHYPVPNNANINPAAQFRLLLSHSRSKQCLSGIS